LNRKGAICDEARPILNFFCHKRLKKLVAQRGSQGAYRRAGDSGQQDGPFCASLWPSLLLERLLREYALLVSLHFG